MRICTRAINLEALAHNKERVIVAARQRRSEVCILGVVVHEVNLKWMLYSLDVVLRTLILPAGATPVEVRLGELPRQVGRALSLPANLDANISGAHCV